MSIVVINGRGVNSDLWQLAVEFNEMLQKIHTIFPWKTVVPIHQLVGARRITGLCVAVMICAILVNTQTDTQAETQRYSF